MKNSFYIFPNPIFLDLSGKHASRYIQNRVTNDIRGMKPGDHRQAAALSPQGRTEGFFEIICFSDEHFLLVCDGGDPEKVKAAFSRFIVADRIDIKDRSGEFALISLQGEGTLESITSLAKYPRKRISAHCIDIVADKATEPEIIAQLIASGSQQMSLEQYSLERIKAKVPSFPEELNEEYLFSESGLLEAVSFKKGCYVGQEVVEKVDALGKLPKSLNVLKFSGSGIKPEDDVKIDLNSASIGAIISVAKDPVSHETYCFASLRNSSIPESRQVICNGVQGVVL